MINIGLLKNFTRAKKFLPGSVIFNGSICDALYIVLKGEAGVFMNYRKQNQEMVGVFGPGDVFGEAALFLEKKQPSMTVALTDIFVMPVYRNNTAAFIKDEPEIAFELMKELCSRLDNVGAAYEKLAGRPYAESKPVHKSPAVQSAHTPKSALTKPAVQPGTPKAAALAQNVPTTPPSPILAKPAVKQANPHPPASSPAAPVQAPAEPVHFSLFPEGHGDYQLTLNNQDHEHLLEKATMCPICKKEFRVLKVRTAKLALESTDRDMRSRYKGIEPLYYDVITCPHCLYSALAEMFDKPDKPKAQLPIELQDLKDASIKFGKEMDTHSVFAGYYLALTCAPAFFVRYHFALAKLLSKLSRIYQDCGDRQMEESLSRQALDAYLHIYLNIEIPPNQEQQICIMIGELYLKLNDFKNAKNYFFTVKKDRSAAPRLQRHAEDRLFDIHELENTAGGAG